MADAEIGDRLDRWRNAQSRAQIVVPDDADPADADIFRPRGEPEIPHGADRAAEVHFGLMGRPSPIGPVRLRSQVMQIPIGASTIPSSLSRR